MNQKVTMNKLYEHDTAISNLASDIIKIVQELKKIKIEQSTEKQDSIKINRTSAGKYSFEIKRYYNADKDNANEIINEIKLIENKLDEKFNGE